MGLLTAFAGCASPDKANIQLRKDNQKLIEQVASLKSRHDADEATIRANQTSGPIVPSLPQERLEKLFTTHGITLGRLTGGDDWDSSTPGDDGLKIYAAPVDEQGDPIKAAGAFKVEAFDLGDPAKPLIGTWVFTADQARNLFSNHLVLYTYVLPCPWQTVPKHHELTVKVTFDDELTGREFIAQKQVQANVNVPTTQPAKQ